MSTISRARRVSDTRSGGKIVRGRRIAAAKTPYDRPRPPPPVPENPNWLSGLIFPATRLIATGAGKLLSSVFGADTSSSSSSSSSDSDSISEDDVDDKNDNGISSQGAGRLNKKNGTSSEMITCSGKEPQPTSGKSETKHVIEQLLMQEKFSREECNRLIKIIKSRLIDCPSVKEGEDGRLSEISNRTVGRDAQPDVCSTAVMEAKKWLEEKKLGSSSKSELNHGTCTLNSVMLPHVTEGEVGSPVDMAKFYMRARPPWASPSLNHSESKTPSTKGMHLFMEETPYSIGGNSLSSSKLKRDSLASGSWNIVEEMRRVRAKATEDMLGTSPSWKIDLSAFASEHKTSQNSLVADKIEASVADKLHDSNSLTVKKSVDASFNLAAGVTTSHGFPVSEMTQDGLRNEALSANPAIFVSEENQDLESIRIIEGQGSAASNSHHSIIPDFPSKQHNGLQDGLGKLLSSGQKLQSSENITTVVQSDAGDVDGLKDTHGFNQPPSSIVGGTVKDSRSNDTNCSTLKEVTGSRGTFTANGFPPSGSSLSEGLDTEKTPKPSNEEHANPVSSSHDKMGNSVPVQETCELLSETSIEVPIINDTETAASGSENSSSMRHEELSQDLIQPNLKHRLAGKTGSMVEKQQGEKLRRYNKKGGRGRGK